MVAKTQEVKGNMSAWVQHELGEPLEVLSIEEVEIPAPSRGQVLIKVEATGLSYGDLLFCRGLEQESTPLPYTPGNELSGTIVALGEGSLHAVGERVCALPANHCGGLAEYVIADDGVVFPAGTTMTAAEAAVFIIAYHTSWFALHRRAALSSGETLLVHSGAGGVGSACIQLGKAAGAKVIATAGGKEKVELCKAMGADIVVDHTTTDFKSVVKEVTNGVGVNVVIDTVNGDVFDRSRRCIAPEGRLMVIGFVGNSIATLKTNHVLLKNYTVMGMTLPYHHESQPELTRKAHQDMLYLHAQGVIKPLIQRQVSFEEAAQGIGDLPSRKTWGRVVVNPLSE